MNRLHYDEETQSVTNVINSLINGYQRNCKGKRELESHKKELMDELQFDENLYILHAIRKSLHLITYKNVLANPSIDITILETYRGRIDPEKFFPEFVTPTQICCYCGIKSRITQEHVLKKESYFQYAISPCNIVPACADCNNDKGVWSIDGDQTRTPFHPYFENYDFRPYLECNILYEKSFKCYLLKERDCFTLEIDINQNLKNQPQFSEFERYSNNFKMFKLKKIYSIYANAVISEFAAELKSVADSENIILENNKNYILKVLEDWIEQRKQSDHRYSFMTEKFAEKLALEKLIEFLISKTLSYNTDFFIECIKNSSPII